MKNVKYGIKFPMFKPIETITNYENTKIYISGYAGDK